MERVNVGVVGLGNVGLGTLSVLAGNAEQIALKLGFELKVSAVCSRNAQAKELPAAYTDVFRTNDYRELIARPDVDIVVELVGGTTVAADVMECAIAHKKS